MLTSRINLIVAGYFRNIAFCRKIFKRKQFKRNKLYKISIETEY